MDQIRKRTPKSDSNGDIRLNKAIADSGLCSRREADRLIEEGRVTVNGKKVYELGQKVKKSDKVLVDSKPLKNKFQRIYLMLNKPKGYLSTMEDPLERPTLVELLSDVPTRVFSVGRLDWDSEGLILLTNDGDYAQKVMHPKSAVEKCYLVKLNGDPTDEELRKLKSGVTIIGGRVSAKHIERAKVGHSKENKWIKIVITEGKNRQVRQMFAKIGYDVLKLQRVSIGRLRIGSLERGDYVYLNELAAQKVFESDVKEPRYKPVSEFEPFVRKTSKTKKKFTRRKPTSLRNK